MEQANAFLNYELTVSHQAIDEFGHVNNTVYLNWLQDAAVAHSTALGYSLADYTRLGCGWVASSHYIRYMRPCYENDQITVKTWIASIKGNHSIRRYLITRQGKTVAYAETVWAFVSFTSKRPCAIPPEVAVNFVIPENPPEFPDTPRY